MKKNNSQNEFKKIKKYIRNPFLNTKEDYYNEIVQKVICSILYNKNIKKIDYLVFDLLFDYFLKNCKYIVNQCKEFSALRGTYVINYIDLKFCLKLHFYPLYKQIYIDKDYKFINNFLDIDNAIKKNSINVIQHSYMYYKEFCMKKNENINYTNSFSKKNNFCDYYSNNKDVNVLFLNENIDIEKYKKLMKLKKKYIHDHMPIIPLSINRKEEKTKNLNNSESSDQDSNSLTDNSYSSSSSASSLSSYSSSSNYLSPNSEENKDNSFNYESLSNEKIRILNLLPKLKEIYSENMKNKVETTKTEFIYHNSFNSIETFDDF